MKFKYSVIGDNTQENREWLEKVGYRLVNKFSCPCRKIITYPDGVYTLSPMSITNRTDVIDCIGNPPLFKAVSAMREDRDYMQWFTDGRYWFRCFNYDKVELEFRDKEKSASWLEFPHKATLEELQERFKEKER